MSRRAQSTSTRCRPRYQPQLLHTVCGSRDAPQLGHRECAGGSSRMFADLRERVAERLILRFGTAIRGLLADLEVERPQGRPTWVEFFGCAAARRDVAVDAARWAEARAVGTAQRRGRQLKEQRVAQEWFEVDDVDIELVRLTSQWVWLEQLVDVDVELTLDRSKTPTARSLPACVHGAADDDAVRDPHEGAVDLDRSSAGDLGAGVAQLRQRRRDRKLPRRAGPLEQVGDGNAEGCCGDHGSALGFGLRDRPRRAGDDARECTAEVPGT